MRPRSVDTIAPAVLLLLVGGLSVLARLQYRWIDEVARAERERMRSNIDFAMRRLADDVHRELEPLFRTFGFPGPHDAVEDARNWRRSAAHPEMVSAIFEAVRTEDNWQLYTVDPESADVEPVSWPSNLTAMRKRLEDREPWRGRGVSGRFFDETTALLFPRRQPLPPGAPIPQQPFGPERAAIVVLDIDAIAVEILPDLVRRHFATGNEGEYDIVLKERTRTLYSSAAGVSMFRPDAEIAFPLFGGMGEGLGNPGPEPFDRPRFGEPRPEWTLMVRRHDGGLDAIVGRARRRNLAVSFGILLILGATTVLLLALLRRSARLHDQQTEFVASMSHELNTPVAALRAAGENLRDGIVNDPERLSRYGSAIVREASRLAELLGQILEFAGMQARRVEVRRESLDVGAIVHDATEQCRWLAEQADVQMEVDIADELPPVSGDAEALTRAIQNLVANAIRHGASGKWVRVRAEAVGDHLDIAVEDRGPGFDRAEASRLFEPFFRGRGSAPRGAGLGLAIVRRIVSAHGGRVLAERRRPGAAFIIRIPGGAHG